MIETEKKEERVLLIGVELQGMDNFDLSMEELASLAKTAGAVVVDTYRQKRDKYDSKTFVGSGKLEEILMKESTDYVSIQLTDEGEINVFDMQERIRRKFPNVLEVRRQNLQSVDYQMQYDPEEDMDAFSLCRAFLKDVDQEEEKLLKEVINFVQEVEECDQ